MNVLNINRKPNSKLNVYMKDLLKGKKNDYRESVNKSKDINISVLTSNYGSDKI